MDPLDYGKLWEAIGRICFQLLTGSAVIPPVVKPGFHEIDPIKEFEETLIRSGLRGCCVERDIGDFYRLFI